MNADEMHTIVSSFSLKCCAFAAYSTAAYSTMMMKLIDSLSFISTVKRTFSVISTQTLMPSPFLLCGAPQKETHHQNKDSKYEISDKVNESYILCEKYEPAFVPLFLFALIVTVWQQRNSKNSIS